MKTKLKSTFIFPVYFIILITLFSVSGCNMGGEVEPDYIPSLNMYWIDNKVSSLVTHGITFSTKCTYNGAYLVAGVTSCTNNEQISGSDNYKDKDGKVINCKFLGLYKNHHIEWTYTSGPLINEKYSGRINGGTITVNSSKLGDLVLLVS